MLNVTARTTIAFAGTYTPPVMPSGVFRTRSYIDPVMMGLQGGVLTSNFEVVKLASWDERGVPYFNDIAKWQVADYAYLKSLQFEEAGEYGSVEKKMRWLCNHNLTGTPTRPYWLVEGGELRFGTILFGRQQVQVETYPDGTPVEYERKGKYPARDADEWIVFYRVLGLRKADYGKVTHESHPWLVQQCTAIEGGKATDLPRGVVHYHPVWSDLDFPSNYGDGKLYVAKEFLESV